MSKKPLSLLLVDMHNWFPTDKFLLERFLLGDLEVVDDYIKSNLIFKRRHSMIEVFADDKIKKNRKISS